MWWFGRVFFCTAVYMMVVGTSTTTRVDAYDFDSYCPRFKQGTSQTKRNLVCPKESSEGGSNDGKSAQQNNNKNKNNKNIFNNKDSNVPTINWDSGSTGGILDQEPEYYKSQEARRIAETVMAYQHVNGGWHKHYVRTKSYTTKELRHIQLELQSSNKEDQKRIQMNTPTTIDNGSTVTEIRFLAKVAYEHRREFSNGKDDNSFLGGSGSSNTSMNQQQRKLQLRYQHAITQGIDFLLKSQYTNNGGWPQTHPPPLKEGYHKHVTFNDNAMINVLELLHDIAIENQQVQQLKTQQRQKYQHAQSKYPQKPSQQTQQNEEQNDNDQQLVILYPFLSSCNHHYIETALEKGIQAVLDTQIVIGGDDSSVLHKQNIENKPKLTGWAQQYNLLSLKHPTQARTFEPPSICGLESNAIVKFLMSIENPSQPIINAIESAIQWFDVSSLQDIQYECYYDQAKKRNDKRIVATDSSATNSRLRGDTTTSTEEGSSTPPVLPLWARYYDINDGKTPIFQDRDGTIYLNSNELSYERRVGYTWYTDTPNTLFCNEYPTWKLKMQKLESQLDVGDGNSPFDDSDINKKKQQSQQDGDSCPPLPNNDSTLFATEEDYAALRNASSASSSIMNFGGVATGVGMLLWTLL